MMKTWQLTLLRKCNFVSPHHFLRTSRRIKSNNVHRIVGGVSVRTLLTQYSPLNIIDSSNICDSSSTQRLFFTSSSASSNREEQKDNFGDTSPNNNNDTSSNSNNSNNNSLRKLAQTFIRNYHPDVLQNESNPTVQSINLKAVQTLNELIDVIDTIYNHAASTTVNIGDGTLSAASTIMPRLDDKYIIEFMVPSSSSSSLSTSTSTKTSTSTRRSVELSFTKKERDDVQSIHPISGKYSIKAANRLKIKGQDEIVKLLKVAGLVVPKDYYDERRRNTFRSIESDDYDTEESAFVRDQLDIEDENMNHPYYHSQRRNQQHQQRSLTPYEQSRQTFIKEKMNYKKYTKLYSEALEDAKRNAVTTGLIHNNEGRRRRMVSDLMSRIRIYDNENTITKKTKENKYDDANNNGLDIAQQLIAIRRITLLFNENFELLRLEQMGRVWEHLVIVLMPSRLNNNDNRKSKIESGFKFSFHDGTRLTAYIPIDFLDYELLNEMSRHLEDLNELMLDKDQDIDDLLPSYYKYF